MDYFTVKQSFYNGLYEKVSEEASKSGKVEDVTIKYYQLRSESALGQLKAGGDDSLSQAFALYETFLKDSKHDLSKLESHVKGKNCLYHLNLLASAQAIKGDVEESLKTCVEGIDSGNEVGVPDLLLSAIEVALLNNKASTASTMFENYTSTNADSLSSEDELIINLAESYIKFATNVDTSSSNFYHFEELAQTFPTWKSQLGLLNLQLQQGNTTEAQSIVDLLESEYYSKNLEAVQSYKGNFSANKITLAIMEGEKSKAEELRSELKQFVPNHGFNKSHEESTSKFDEIVVKYKN